jgi:putative transposase
MCQLAGVSRSPYYRHWQDSAPLEMDVVLRDRIQQIAIMMDRNYGYRRVAKVLKNDGWVVNHKRVLRLMKQDNLLCLRHKAFVPVTTDSRHLWRVWPNLARVIQTTAINQLWVADITYIRLREEFVFLAIVLDAHSRRAIGWSLQPELDARVAIQALDMAISSRNPEPGMIHHSDRGVQYACSDYTTMLLQRGIQISMSRIGNPYDNAKAESFIKTLKYEQLYGLEFRNIDQLRRSIQNFIECIYNRQRLHSALSYRSPVEFEATCSDATDAALNKPTTGKGGWLPPSPDPIPRSNGRC